MKCVHLQCAKKGMSCWGRGCTRTLCLENVVIPQDSLTASVKQKYHKKETNREMFYSMQEETNP